MCLCLVITYLITVLLVQLAGLGCLLSEKTLLPESYNLWISCALIGGVGGTMYCMRGVYINYCVNKTWDKIWVPWYLLRPIVSFVAGGISYVFVMAGLLLIVPKTGEALNQWGLYAFAFWAGYKVDAFMKKAEGACDLVQGK